mgnify:FL=1
MKEVGAKPISIEERVFEVGSKISFGAAGLMAAVEIANKAIELIKTHKVTGSEADLILGLGVAAMYGIGAGFREKLPIRSN